MIPKKIHFIFGLTDGFFNKPFCYFHYLNFLSAKKTNSDYEIYVHYKFEPTNNPYWNLVKEEFICKKIDLDLDAINYIKIGFNEHKCDYLRLLILKEFGGIYLDSDVVCIKSFDDLLNNDVVMGIQGKRDVNGNYNLESDGGFVSGLCNATILSKSNSEFINIWLDDYQKNYNPVKWDYNCVLTPYLLYQVYPSKIKVVPDTYFFYYLCNNSYDHGLIFNNNIDLTESYCLHLWETINYNILKDININYVNNVNNTLSNLYKKIIK